MTAFVQKTTFLKQSDVKPKWYVIDGEGLVVGRLATQIATVLMGKHKPSYTSHVDTGDYVIVVNADKVRFTGRELVHKSHTKYTTKMQKKQYFWVSGWPGGLKKRSGIELWEENPTKLLMMAINRMMPRSALSRHMVDKLKLFVGPNHPHQAQTPEPFPEWLMLRAGRKPETAKALLKPR